MCIRDRACAIVPILNIKVKPGFVIHHSTRLAEHFVFQKPRAFLIASVKVSIKIYKIMSEHSKINRCFLFITRTTYVSVCGSDNLFYSLQTREYSLLAKLSAVIGNR